MKSAFSARLRGALFTSAAASALVFASAAWSQSAASGATPNSNVLGEIVVTARRSSEKLQSVPVAVSVVSPAAIAAKGTFQPQDLATVSTGLSVVATVGDRSTITYSIRGQNQAFGTLFPAVVTYFSEVPVTRLATGNFYDLDNIQVLRGPQGVLFGRVTDGGNVMLTPRHPTNDLEGYLEVKAGDYGLHNFDGALNVPVIADKLVVRGAFEVDRRDGFTTNLYNGEKLDNVSSEAFRFSVTARPTSWLENYTVVSHQHIDNNGTASILAGLNPAAIGATINAALPLFTGAYGINSIGTIGPFTSGANTLLTPASYLASLQSQLALQRTLGPRTVYSTAPSYERESSLYAVNATTVDITHDIHFKNIFGYVDNKAWLATNFAGDNSNLVLTCYSSCLSVAGSGVYLPTTAQKQFSEEARFFGDFFNDRLTWSIGAYFDHQSPDGEAQGDTVNAGILHRYGVNYSNSWSRAGYAYGEYDASDFLKGLKFNAGYRYTSDTEKVSTVTYLAPIAAPGAQAALAGILSLAAGLPPAVANFLADQTVNLPIPFGQCVTLSSASLFGPFPCRTYTEKSSANTWTFGASYAPASGKLLYVKGSRGYRPGGVNGSSPPSLLPTYAPEWDTSVELGAKADWLFGDGVAARTNIALYHDDYSNIQKGVVVPGPVPLQVVRNVAAATVQGVEIEALLKPVRDLTLSANYAYTDAHFQHQDTSGPLDPCDPTAFSIAGFCTDNMLAFTPRHQVSVSLDYRIPVDESWGDVHVGGLLFYQSRIALTDTSALNPAAIQPGYARLDLNASWSNFMGRPVDLSFFMTNVTNKLYLTAADDLLQNSSVGSLSYVYAPPRMFGFGAKYHFGPSR